MADERLSLNFGIDSTAAVAGIEKVDASLKKVSQSTEVAGDSAAEAAAEFAKLGKEGEEVAKAAAKLEKAGDSPRALIKSSAAATYAVEQLRAKLAAAGQPIPPALEASLKKVETSAASAAKKAGDINEILENTRKAGAAASQGAEAMAGSFGSVEGVFQQMKASGAGVSKSLGDMGLKMGGVVAAFSLGFDLGGKFDGALKNIGIDLAAGSSALSGFYTWLGKTGVAGESLSKTLIAAGKASGEYANLLEPLNVKMNASIKAHQALGKELQEVTKHLKSIGGEFINAAAVQKNFEARVADLGKAFTLALKDGQSFTETVHLNAKALSEVQKALDEGRIKLDQLSPSLRTAVLMFDGVEAAMKKSALASETMRKGLSELDPALVKILTTLREENEAAAKLPDGYLRAEEARKKAIASLKEYGDAHGLTAEQVAKLIGAQKTLLTATNEATVAGLEKQKTALDALGPALNDAAAATKNAAEAMDEWRKQTEDLLAKLDAIERHQWAEKAREHGEVLNRLGDGFRETAKAANECGDAFGRIGQGLTAMNGQLDLAQAGLQGVAWEMRKATPATHELTDAQKVLIEELAKLSDAGGNSSLWVGHLLAQFENGTITLDEFQKKVNELLLGLQKVNSGGWMGDLAGELNALNSLISKFKAESGTGWPSP